MKGKKPLKGKEKHMSINRSKYNAKQKVQMVLESLAHPDGINAYCRVKGIKDSQIHRWRNRILENADRLFEKVSKKDQNRVLRLELELKAKNEIIAELARENLTLKKTFGA
jgi:hypothetical protein